MRSTEIRAAGELLGEACGGTGRFVAEMHEAIAGRAFRAVGPAATPVRAVHDRIAGAMYAGVRQAVAAIPRGGGALLAQSAPPQAPSMAQSTPGSMALGALNGAIGDVLEKRGSELALSMAIRRGGADLVIDPPDLARAFPDATSRLVVFVHGLCETDDAWRLLPVKRRGEAPPPSYGTRLREDLGYTPLYLRYNTGRHISDNGRSLSRLLEDVLLAWPRAVEDVVLIGHSMGGLVARSACHYGQADERRWVGSVRHVFCLGTPHLGAPLEKAANVAGWALAQLAETRPLAKVVNGRSVGIKDLRFGSCAEDDWCDCEPDEFLRDRCCEVPFLETANYYFVGATLSRAPDSPLGSLAGDLLVRFPSASGRGRRRKIGFELDNGCHLGGLNHIDLLNHPSVYEQIRKWIVRPPHGRRELVETASALAG
jgi:pimeloyl-ACP methyl ester carboxylesterase